MGGNNLSPGNFRVTGISLGSGNSFATGNACIPKAITFSFDVHIAFEKKYSLEDKTYFTNTYFFLFFSWVSTKLCLFEILALCIL